MNKYGSVNPSSFVVCRPKCITRFPEVLSRWMSNIPLAGLRFSLLLLVLILPVIDAWAQSSPVTIHAENQPLNEVLLQLRERHDVQLSFNNSELSKYNITLDRTFQNAGEALNYMVRDLPFRVKTSGDVFIIVPDRRKIKQDYINISGQIVESGSMEPLPFSQVQVDSRKIETDESGKFSFSAPTDSIIHVRITHPGYYIYDTILNVGTNKRFRLKSPFRSGTAFNENSATVERSSQIGEKAGNMKVNANIARYLPGQGDNSVFNLLRLMPGIRAAGEQAADLSIWGSTVGQSMVTFDEFTLFGMKNFNDNISVVNPLMVKNMEIFKGGFDARYGNRVGGIVNINGKIGHLRKPVFTFNVNPTTLNGMAELPLFKRSTLLIAGRKTYYNLYDLHDFNIYAPTRPVSRIDSTRHSEYSDINIYPENYRFGDLNVKYSINFKNRDLFFVSAYQGGDFFKLSANSNMIRTLRSGFEIPFSLKLENTEDNSQRGISAYYSRNWGRNNTSKFIVTHSDLASTVNDEIHSENLNNGEIYLRDDNEVINKAGENSIRSENILSLNNGHQLEFGAILRNNSAEIVTTRSFTGDTLVNDRNLYENNRGVLYIQDHLPVTERLVVRSGIRFIVSSASGKIYTEPRLGATWRIGDNVRLNAAWGLYNQFIYKMENIDRFNNISYLWVTGNGSPGVPHAVHYVGGVNYFRNNFTINIDAYYKTIGNLSRQVFEHGLMSGRPGYGYRLYRGDARIAGTDLYVRKDFGQNAVWASWSLSKAEERFAAPGTELPAYSPAPNDQRHEFKIAGLYNIGKFCVSGDYVYGSGIEAVRQLYAGESTDISYNRFNIALVYKINGKKIRGETGISILNVFDSGNLTQNNVKSITISDQLDNIRITTEAVPFTPVLFLRLSF